MAKRAVDAGAFVSLAHPYWNAVSETAGALVAALKAGQFYASQAPDFDRVQIIDNTVRITCSPVCQIVVSGIGATYQFHDVSMIKAEVKLPDRDKTPYVRITIVDAGGRSAWTNPIWL